MRMKIHLKYEFNPGSKLPDNHPICPTKKIQGGCHTPPHPPVSYGPAGGYPYDLLDTPPTWWGSLWPGEGSLQPDGVPIV